MEVVPWGADPPVDSPPISLVPSTEEVPATLDDDPPVVVIDEDPPVDPTT